MRRFVACTMLLSACSAGGEATSPTPLTPSVEASVSIRNDAAVPIVYFAVGEGSLALITIPSTLLPHQYEGRLLAPGETAPVNDILGYHDDLGISFHVWIVDEDANEARYR
ncbi:MAG TPA: hypothetical protein VEB59_14300, partial [Gemmatimonadales bacterium]|nr:hypothetical protein [Gemmatimonadales bacterium]